MIREEVIDWLKYLQHEEHLKADSIVPSCTEIALQMAIEALNQPEIVRCKECKYCGSYIRDGIKFAKCELKHNWMPQSEWFCADGERREDGT